MKHTSYGLAAGTGDLEDLHTDEVFINTLMLTITKLRLTYYMLSERVKTSLHLSNNELTTHYLKDINKKYESTHQQKIYIVLLLFVNSW